MKLRYYFLLTAIVPALALAQHTVSGQIALSNALAVCDVLVELRDSDNQLLNQDFTGEDGVFTFENLPAGEDYLLTFSKDANAINGVSVFDIVLASRIILGITPPQEWQLWAGDVNGSGSVTALDLVLIRKVILSIESSFPAPTWGFDRPNEFPPSNQIQLNNLSESIDLDILAAKRGDLNNSAIICN